MEISKCLDILPSWLSVKTRPVTDSFPVGLEQQRPESIRNSLYFHILKGTTPPPPKCGRWDDHSNQVDLKTTQLFSTTSLDFKTVYTCTPQKWTLKSPALALGSTVGEKAHASLELGFKKSTNNRLSLWNRLCYWNTSPRTEQHFNQKKVKRGGKGQGTNGTSL